MIGAQKIQLVSKYGGSMNNQGPLVDFSKYMKDQKIPLSTRFSNAITISISFACTALQYFFLTPVVFFQNLFMSTRKVIDASKLPENHPLLKAISGNQTVRHEHKLLDEEEEDWMKEHKKNYGNEDED